MRQGYRYFDSSFSKDPVSALIILLGLISAVWSRRARYVVLAIGLSLYMLYTIRVGGDFMAGRFLTMPIFTAAIILLRHSTYPGSYGKIAVAVVALVIGLVKPTCPYRTGGDFGTGPERGEWFHGVGNERAAHFQWSGLLVADSSLFGRPSQPWLDEGYTLREVGDTLVQRGAIGFFGFGAGPEVHILDALALTDPLLSRLPAAHAKRWRIGHFKRVIPYGYEESLRRDTNLIAEDHLAVYYDHLKYVITGPVFSLDRIGESIKLYFGARDSLLDTYTSGTMLVREVSVDGLTVEFRRPRTDRLIEVSVDHNDRWLARFRRDRQTVGWSEIPPEFIEERGLRVDTLAVDLWPVAGDYKQSLGHLMPLN